MILHFFLALPSSLHPKTRIVHLHEKTINSTSDIMSSGFQVSRILDLTCCYGEQYGEQKREFDELTIACSVG